MIIAISGTPGTGKTSLGLVLRSRGYAVIELGDFTREHSLYSSFDEERGSYEVDPEELDKALKDSLPQGTVFLVGHLSHLLTVDLIVILRCRPSVLASRLRGRGWKEPKVRENMEAEACDVILVESLGMNDMVREIDTTSLSPEQTAQAVEEILAGEKEKYAVGHVDWSDEVLGWF